MKGSGKRGWVFVRMGGDHYKFECERCRAELKIGLPAPMQDFIDAMKVFGKRHRRCKPTLQSERLYLLAILRRRAKQTGSFTLTLGL